MSRALALCGVVVMPLVCGSARAQDGPIDMGEARRAFAAAQSASERENWCRRAFVAIVEEEQLALRNASALIQYVRRFASASAVSEKR